jgi:hypothetical protein
LVFHSCSDTTAVGTFIGLLLVGIRKPAAASPPPEVH